MTEKPYNAETPIESLRTWITDNTVFFKRNQGQMMKKPVKLSTWQLSIEGLVKHSLALSFEDIRRMPKVEVANTLPFLSTISPRRGAITTLLTCCFSALAR